jgi:hypothetical protein
MDDLRRRMSSEDLLKKHRLLELAKPEITRALELFVPGLLVDFLAQNDQILDHRGLSCWAAKMDEQRQA